MSMTLYHGEPNGPSLTVLTVLFAKELPAELVRIDLARGERHLLDCAQDPAVAMSVEGEGPVLLVDGEAMTDSVFLACYLDDVGEGIPLRSADPYVRWQTMSWCRQLIERTAPAAAYLGCRAYPPKADATLLERIGSVDLRARWQQIMAGDFSEHHLSDSRAKVCQAVEKVEKQLDGRKWLMDTFSIADIESYAWLAGMVSLVPEAFAGRSRASAWLERMGAHPALGQALARSSSPDPAAVWSVGPEINRWG